MGVGKAMEYQGFRAALRMARRPIRTWLHGANLPEYIWSNFSLSRGISRPAQRTPRVGHFSVPRVDRGVTKGSPSKAE